MFAGSLDSHASSILAYGEKMKIFILGMHRSGTSMITGILHKCGLELGKNLLMSARDNPKGHFESRRFIRINQEILIRNGGRWFSPPKDIKFHPGLKKKMRLFLNEFDPQKISGFKDPRACLTFPLWYQVVYPEPVKVVVVVRPLSNIALSLRRRNNFSFNKGMKLADYYVRSMFDGIHKTGVPYIITFYHKYFKTYKKQIGGDINIIRDWCRELDPILKFTDLKLPEDPRAIDAFIDERLWHFRK